MKHITSNLLLHFFSLLSFCILATCVQAQTLSSVVSPSGEADRTEVKIYEGMNLEHALEKIQQVHNIVFLYRWDVIQGRKVSGDKRLPANLEKALTLLLEGQQLEYHYVNPKTYAIYPSKKIDSQSVQPMIQHPVSGVVTDAASDEPLPGVNVLVKGTGTGTATNSDGEYSLEAPTPQDTLVFSFVGYQLLERPINGESTINVELQPEAVSGEELVVVGYGAQERATLTGSVSDVGGADLERTPALSLSNSFSGRIAGMTALNRSGEPGEDFSELLIRGKSTLGNNDPLIVVDGVPGRQGLNSINPRDVESISVLKDASAAIYGAQAANGVILIETKRGQIGAPEINYSANVGFQQPTRLPEMANSATYAEFLNWQNELNNQPPQYSEEDIQRYREETNPLTHPNTDWYEETLKDLSMQTEHSLSVSGGAENVQYYVSGNYSDQEGIFRDGIHNYNDIGGRANIDAQISNALSVSADVSISEQNRRQPATLTRIIVEDMIRSYPTRHAYYPNGLPGFSLSASSNPALQATDATGYRNNKINLYQTTASFEYEFPFIDGLGVTGRVSYDKRHADFKQWEQPYTTYAYNASTDTYQSNQGGPGSPELTQRKAFSSLVNASARLQYQREVDNHRINAFIAMEQTEDQSNFVQAYRQNYNTSVVDQIFAGGETNMQTDGSATRFARRNFFGRVSYGFQDKYLIDINARYDGSTNFPAHSRYGFFPGISVGWVLSEESFMQEVDIVENLKLRGSWGQMGNDQIPPFQYLATYSLTRGAIFGTNKTVRQGTQRGVEPNPNVTWEESSTTNIGVDAELWEGLLGITLDVFKTRRENILTSRFASVPSYTGLDLPDENIGIVENKGFEFQLSHRNVLAGDFNYALEGNISFSRNEVIYMDEAPDTPEWQRQEGMPMDSDLYYNAIGIYRSQDEIDNSPHPPGTRVNDLQYEDVNDDGQINDLDQIRLAQTNTPEVIFGTNVSFWYKNLDLQMLLQGQTRAWRYFWVSQGNFGNVMQDFAENRPGPDNPDSKYPNVYSNEDQVSAWESDFWLYDASFLRLKNLELGYTVPVSLTDRLGVKNVRIYANGFNLLTFDKLGLLDPEGHQPDGPSGRGAFYPPNRIYNFGIDITL